MIERMCVSKSGYSKFHLFIVTVNQSSWYLLFLSVVYVDLINSLSTMFNCWNWDQKHSPVPSMGGNSFMCLKTLVTVHCSTRFQWLFASRLVCRPRFD
jgi:hypothetical protein